MGTNNRFRISRRVLLFASLLVVVLVSSLFVCAFMMNDSSGASLEDAVHVKNETELKDAINNAPNDKPTTIALDNDITLTLTTNNANTNGATTHILIQDKDITLTNNKATGHYKLIGAANGHVLFVGNGGTLRIDGITITHTSNTKGRGIINFLGTLYLYSGTISNNPYGGVDNSGVFEMSGGEISNNGNGEYKGGGVVSSGTFKMSGGTITDNRAEYGGGVHSGFRDIFTMTGGKISGNTADYGGGVSIVYGEFTMAGGEISGNKAKYDGGGVHNANLSTFTMTGGKISGNTANNGGGVYNIYTFNRHGGVISGNTAVNGDNDVFSDNNGKGGANNSNNKEPTIGSFSLWTAVAVCIIIIITLIITILVLFVYFQKRIKQVEKQNNSPHISIFSIQVLKAVFS